VDANARTALALEKQTTKQLYRIASVYVCEEQELVPGGNIAKIGVPISCLPVKISRIVPDHENHTITPERKIPPSIASESRTRTREEASRASLACVLSRIHHDGNKRSAGCTSSCQNLDGFPTHQEA
jgi:hypothetical protein